MYAESHIDLVVEASRGASHGTVVRRLLDCFGAPDRQVSRPRCRPHLDKHTIPIATPSLPHKYKHASYYYYHYKVNVFELVRNSIVEISIAFFPQVLLLRKPTTIISRIAPSRAANFNINPLRVGGRGGGRGYSENKSD